jgi:hypothetical protein
MPYADKVALHTVQTIPKGGTILFRVFRALRVFAKRSTRVKNTF